MRRVSLAALALSLFAPSSALAVEYVNDPLTSDTFPGRGSKGGSFSPNGWTTSNEPDAVWYEVPDALPSGRVEYTVTGISTATTLTGADHDIFTLYQAPSGVPEPVAYSPYFRNNDFKAFTRVFGQQEPGRNGAMKLELAFCPRGDPGYHDDACPASCDGSGIAYANGTDKDIGWDGAASYRMALEWGGGAMRFYRDNVLLGTVSYPGEYAPQPIRIRLGSPRHDGVYPGLALMPKGITFRDLVVTGTPGAMTPVCGAMTMPDAGPPPDAGGGENGVLADVTAASWEPGVFPDVNDLNVEGDGNGNPGAVVYLRFPAAAGYVANAMLYLRSQAFGSAAGGSGVICGVDDDTWDESTLTWGNRPPISSNCVGTPKSIDPDTEVGWDVTALVKAGKPVNLAVVSDDANGAHYFSKESGGAALGPRLVVQLGVEPPDAGGAGGSGNGGAGTGAAGGGGVTGGSGGTNGQGGSGANAGNGGEGGEGGSGGSGSSGGCGCRTAGGASASPIAAVALALLVARARRRRRA